MFPKLDICFSKNLVCNVCPQLLPRISGTSSYKVVSLCYRSRLRGSQHCKKHDWELSISSDASSRGEYRDFCTTFWDRRWIAISCVFFALPTTFSDPQLWVLPRELDQRGAGGVVIRQYAAVTIIICLPDSVTSVLCIFCQRFPPPQLLEEESSDSI